MSQERDDFPRLDWATVPVEEGALDLIPASLINQYRVLPIRKIADDSLVVGMVSFNEHQIEDIEKVTRLKVITRRITEEEFEEHRPRRPGVDVPAAYKAGTLSDVEQMLNQIRQRSSAGETGGIEPADGPTIPEDAPLIRMTNVLLQNAIKLKAKVIQILPERRQLIIQYLTPEGWQTVMTLPKFAHAALVNSFKVMADLNVAERRIPQEGVMPLKYERVEYRARVGCYPTFYGEAIEVELKRQGPLSFDKIYFTAEDLSKLHNVFEREKTGIVICWCFSRFEGDEFFRAIIEKLIPPPKLFWPAVETADGDQSAEKTVTVSRRYVQLVEHRPTQIEVTNAVTMCANPMASLSFDAAVSQALRLHYGVLAVDNLEYSVAQRIFGNYDRLILAYLSAADEAAAKRILTQDFQIAPSLLEAHLKAIVGLDNGKVTVTIP